MVALLLGPVDLVAVVEAAGVAVATLMASVATGSAWGQASHREVVDLLVVVVVNLLAVTHLRDGHLVRHLRDGRLVLLAADLLVLAAGEAVVVGRSFPLSSLVALPPLPLSMAQSHCRTS